VVRRCLVVLTVLAVLTAAHVGQALLVPFSFAVVFTAVLSPLASRLRQIGMPGILAALVAVATPLLAIGTAIVLLMPRSELWRYRVPVFLQSIEPKIDGLLGSLNEARDLARQVQDIAQGGGGDGDTEGEGAQPIEVTTEADALGLGLLYDIPILAASASVTVILTIFLLAIVPGQLRRLAHGRPFGGRLSRGLAVSGQRLAEDVARYYLTVTAINIGLGIATAVAMAVLGMPQPYLWGAVGGLVNFVPYAGPVVGAGIIAIVALITFDAPLVIALPPLAYIALTTIEGYFVTPVLVGRSLTLNPLLVLLSVLFWGWLWGVGGAFLAVPMLAFTLRLAALPLALRGRPVRRAGPLADEGPPAAR
jgi:predicted PurR-regulated permease PerM